MHVIADGVEAGMDGGRRYLRACAFNQHQFRASGVETRRAAFIDLNMRLTVANDALMRLHE